MPGQLTQMSPAPQGWDDPVIPLEKPFVDARGEIIPLVDAEMKSCVLITSKKGTVRANHYHKTDWHYCYVLEGEIEYHWRPVDTKEPAKKKIIKKGELFYTGPMLEHAMVFLTDTVFLTLGGNPRDQYHYEQDLVRVPLVAA